MNSVLAISNVVIKELYRRKDFYVLFVLTALITIVLGSVNFFNDPKIARYLKDVCLLLIWISSLVIAITTAARQIPAERENRTIFPLLAKPVTRGQVIAGKFLGCWLACGFTLLVFYTFFTVVSGARESSFNLEATLKAAWLHWMLLGVVVSMVLFGSILFSAPSANITICFIAVVGILGLGRHLHRVALDQPQPVSTLLTTIYFAIPHLEWFYVPDFLVNDQKLASWLDCGLASVYGAAYAVFFMFAAWMLFRRRTLSV
jgi:Cu-processing system permease protein